MRDEAIDVDSGVDHSREAQRTTDFFTAQAVRCALALRQVPHDYVILWKEGGMTYQWSWRGASAERLEFMREGLRIDVDYGQWAAGYTYYDGEELRWKVCGTSSGLISYMKSMPPPNSKKD